MYIKLNFEGINLIQTVRAKHAVMEHGYNVSISRRDLKPYEYLSKFFRLNYNHWNGRAIDVELSHSKPFVRVGNITKPLLYPMEIFDKSREFWGERQYEFFFQGLIPDFRRKALSIWADRATIVETSNGRSGVDRYWDVPYLQKLGKAKFVLCPNGGYPWSYRFFEAIMCGAVPIVETEVPCYNGFYYHKWRDTTFEYKNIVENFELAKTLLTITSKELADNIIYK